MNERLKADLALAWSLAEQLAAIPKQGSAETNARMLPGSTVPIHVAAIDQIRSLELFTDSWITRSRWILDPQPVWHLSATTGVVCPNDDCRQPSLVAFPKREQVTCRSCGQRWRGKDEWNLLARILAGQNPNIVVPESGPGKGANLRGAKPRWDRLGELIVEPRGGAA